MIWAGARVAVAEGVVGLLLVATGVVGDRFGGAEVVGMEEEQASSGRIYKAFVKKAK